MTDGYKQSEIAAKLGLSNSSVAERLNELRNELLLQSGRFFPLTDNEYTALRASIERDGIQAPVLLGRHIPLIDGRHRLLIADELDIPCPCVLLDNLTPEQERELAITLNVARRQLNQAQKRSLVQSELMRNPARTDRLIGTICGVDHVTVGDIRLQLAEEEHLLNSPAPVNLTSGVSPQEREAPQTATTRSRTRYEPETRIDSRGNPQRAPEPALTRRRDRPVARQLGHADCIHGARHVILLDQNGYRLELEPS